ncbi:ABC transporter ATP-binding protein [Winogradskya humida]|uniref:Multidrug ABC transporter ATP-binding protein n=1 Tax=Winogradskya humida TaxID=113566 RepID=A0ABQ4A5N3_9ACTN|nr:ABC transporter ATP-binding protein [Actinoplanes humidus]GIE26148.1 multidrug ABC transporter ATP-binding protein [Actinoplanes humidus]
MLIRLLRARLRPYRGRLAALVLLQVVQIAATLLLPTLNADIIDNGVVAADPGRLAGTGAVMVLVTCVQVAAALAAAWLAAHVAMAVGRDLRALVFRRVQDFSAREVGLFGTSSLVTRTLNDVRQVQTLTLNASGIAVSAPIMCAGGVALALRQDVPAAGVLVALVPAVGVVAGLILHRMSPLYARMQLGLDRLNRILREQITGVRVVRAFVRDDHERARFRAADTDLFVVSVRVGRLVAAMFPAVLLTMNLFSVVLLSFGAVRVESGKLEVGELNAFLGYQTLILVSVIMAMLMFMAAPRAEVSAGRILEVLDTGSSIAATARPARPGTTTGRLDITGAGFRYAGAEQPVLGDVTLSARPGQTIAIVGSTGSGKTTLLNLVMRLLETTAGQVRVNGVPVRDLDPAVLARTVGYVPQRAYLFSGTVASTLRYGCPDATDADLWRMLDVVQAREFVRQLPEGLDTPVAQGGTDLSGGQRQRLAIARTLLRRPEILLLDDCFSALDATTAAAVRAGLAVETSHATVLIVAQHIASIRHADRILVLDAGRVVAGGTHDELLLTSAEYREIALSQSGRAPSDREQVGR